MNPFAGKGDLRVSSDDGSLDQFLERLRVHGAPPFMVRTVAKGYGSLEPQERADMLALPDETLREGIDRYVEEWGDGPPT